MNGHKNQDLILDFETMSQDESCCAVIDCAALAFDWKRFVSQHPYSFDELVSCVRRFKLDVKHQVKEHGYVVDPETVKFWSDTSANARQRIAPSKDDLTLDQFGTQFMEYIDSLGKLDWWWTRANNFDPPILYRLLRKTDNISRFAKALPFYTIRDVRTFIDAKFNFTTANGFVPIADEVKWHSMFVQHFSTHDVAADVMRLQAITRAEHDLDQI